jgi:hypothetical protein
VIFSSGIIQATIGVQLVGAISAAHNAVGLADERPVVGIDGQDARTYVAGQSPVASLEDTPVEAESTIVGASMTKHNPA